MLLLLELGVFFWTMAHVWVWEREDRYRIEDLGKELKKKDLAKKDVRDIVYMTERLRRVTWRMGVCGAALLAFMLCMTRAIAWDKFWAAAVPSWIVITSVLNFRAYHLEDICTEIVNQFLKD